MEGSRSALASQDARLCYIDGPWAYFTTQDLESQWGDDWNDAPYEHNAGTPYEWREERYDLDERRMVPNREPRWEIVRVAFDAAGLETPAELYGPNSPYSVEQINAQAHAWLTEPGYGTRPRVFTPVVWAGCTLTEFIELIESARGSVYLAHSERSEDALPNSPSVLVGETE